MHAKRQSERVSLRGKRRTRTRRVRAPVSAETHKCTRGELVNGAENDDPLPLPIKKGVPNWFASIGMPSLCLLTIYFDNGHSMGNLECLWVPPTPKKTSDTQPTSQ